MHESNPNFISPELRSAFEELRPRLEGAEESRNRVTKDIRALENYLQSIRFTFAHRQVITEKWISPLLEDTEKRMFDFAIEVGGGECQVHEEALVWDVDPPAGRFRLLHESCRWDGRFCCDGTLPDEEITVFPESIQRTRKPLDAAPWETRKRIFPMLPTFLRGLVDEMMLEELANSSAALEA